ncbi:MAG: hypothetical protein ACLUMK_00760 [Christensenellales bacterium]
MCAIPSASRRRAQKGSAKPEKGAKKPEENRAEAQIVPTPEFKPDEQPFHPGQRRCAGRRARRTAAAAPAGGAD